jgi:hypothetical protein
MTTPAETHVTREDLYELVWSEPLSVIARRTTISDVGLAKICRRLRVPVPGRGYWARNRGGQRVRRLLLPELPLSAPNRMRYATIPGLGSSSVDVIVAQRRYAAEHPIVVANQLVDPHPLVAQSAQILARLESDRRGFLHSPTDTSLALVVSRKSIGRALCIFDALIRALEARGFRVALCPGPRWLSTAVLVGQEEIHISMSEGLDAAGAPCGGLWIHLSSRRSERGRRTIWADGKRQRMETCLDSLITGLVGLAEDSRNARLAEEAAEKARREQEAAKRLEMERATEEASRTRALVNAVEQWRRANETREFIAAMERGMDVTLRAEAPTAAWIAWARAYADQIDPLFPTPKIPV